MQTGSGHAGPAGQRDRHSACMAGVKGHMARKGKEHTGRENGRVKVRGGRVRGHQHAGKVATQRRGQPARREQDGDQGAQGKQGAARGHSAGSEQDGSPLIGRLTLALLFAMELELVVLHVGTRSGAESIVQRRGGWRLPDDAL